MEDKLALLAERLKGAKSIINKVESGDYEKGNVTLPDAIEGIARTDEDSNNQPQYLSEEQALQMGKAKPAQMHQIPTPMPQEQPTYLRNASSSKMPAAILQSFTKNPIAIDPTVAPSIVDNGMSSMMNEVAKKMGIQPKSQPQQKQVYQEQYQTPQQPQMIAAVAPQLDTKLIEYIIKKTVEETLEQVNKKTPLSENIQIKIGDRTFSGKITSLNELKTTATTTKTKK